MAWRYSCSSQTLQAFLHQRKSYSFQGTVEPGQDCLRNGSHPQTRDLNVFKPWSIVGGSPKCSAKQRPEMPRSWTKLPLQGWNLALPCRACSPYSPLEKIAVSNHAFKTAIRSNCSKKNIRLSNFSLRPLGPFSCLNVSEPPWKLCAVWVVAPLVVSAPKSQLAKSTYVIYCARSSTKKQN